MEIDAYVYDIDENPWNCIGYVWKLMNIYEVLMKFHEMYRICMNINEIYKICMKNDEHVWNMCENQWQCIDYIWNLMNMYRLSMKINENIKYVCKLICTHELLMEINENV